MNGHLILLPLLLALLFVSTPTDGTETDKSKTQGKSIDKSNSTLISINIENDIKKLSKDTVGSSEPASNNATKVVEKVSYPKKVHALKKRPAKTPTLYAVTSATPNGKSKRKKVIDVAAVFKDLPADDVEFIKELDKQFQLHGDKIKIKVERDNSTEAVKQTSKRTIDGELGYGSYQSQGGYVYERPKFMFYPYSQRSIPADAPGYYPPKTDVSIEPSYSYELQPETYEQEQQTPKVLDVPQHPQQAAPQQQEHGGYEEPVIVLRIPGPTKYASHLQTLLQQYLEIRAAQYLRILEEAEKQQQQQQHYAPQHAQQQQEEHQLLQQQQQHEQHAQHVYQQQVQQQQQHAHAPAQEYVEPNLELQPPAHQQHEAQHAPAPAEEHNYAPEVNYAHHVAPTPQAVVYPEIDQVYHSYKGRLNAQQVALHHQQHQQQQQQHQPQHHQQEQQIKYAPEQQQQYVPQQQVEYAPAPQAQVEQPQHEQQYYVHAAQQPGAQQYYYVPMAQVGVHGSHHYQNIYFMAIAPQGAYNEHAAHDAPLQHQPIYVQEEEQGLQHYHAQQQQQQEHKHAHEQHELISAHAAAAAAENSPRQTHTKVIYTHNAEKGAADYAGGYKLPSIRPFERHTGKSPVAAYHQQQQQLQEQLLHDEQQHEQLEHEPQQHIQQHEQQQQYDYDTQVGTEHAQPSAAISPRPFNYHAHSAKPARRRNRKRGTATTTTTTTSATTTDAEVDEHLQKIREFVRENLGAKMSTAVEFKTTAVAKS